MSSTESLIDLQWLCVLTLFVASVVTLLVYFVQYFSNIPPVSHSGRKTETKQLSEEAEELLCWTLGLKSWRNEWRKAWLRALNQESKAEGELQLTFEEDDVQSSELSVGHISSFTKAAGHKKVQCEVFGEKLQFSLIVSQSSMEPPVRYRALLSPVQLQLVLQLREVDGQVGITWAVEHLDSTHLQLTHSCSQRECESLGEAVVMARLRKVLSNARPSVTLSSRPAEDVRSGTPLLTSPPKPPRAHDWKLLVKNIRVTCREEDTAGSVSLQCVLQLDDPPQKLSTSVLNNTHTPVWEQPFIFELSGRSKELNIQLLDSGRPSESAEGCLLGQVCVPFDLVKRHPRGPQTFALMSAERVIGSLSSEFSFLEPREIRSWQPPTPAVAKRVEMDRTVMPCGTVVTTVTAVRSRPGRSLPSGNTGLHTTTLHSRTQPGSAQSLWPGRRKLCAVRTRENSVQSQTVREESVRAALDPGNQSQQSFIIIRHRAADAERVGPRGRGGAETTVRVCKTEAQITSQKEHHHHLWSRKDSSVPGRGDGADGRLRRGDGRDRVRSA
ncbi:C2 domain-containing protein 2 isoform X2 [Hoplias malabaricus]|uniref:C2 domain-containing protein 2 isoform X2 n=1 Tax=Hoplias malabaricus TaxID=27720 RepID=UPI0034633D16